MFEVDYDRQILEAKQLIENLEEKKAQQESRNEGIVAFDQAVRDIFKEYGLTERDLFLLKSSPIVDWVKAVGEQEKPASIFYELKNYFYTLVEQDIKLELKQKKEQKPKVKKTPKSKPTLSVGVYRNPITEELIEKKRRNPKPLDLWVQEFGFDKVSSWKQD